MTKEPSYHKFLLEQISIPTKLLSSYHRIPLSERELLLVLQIFRYQHEGNEFPTPGQLAQALNIPETACSDLLRNLIEQEFLEIEEYLNEQGQLSERYSLEPLWQKLYTNDESDLNKEEGKLFVLFEQEFGRPLSPIEIETINVWLDEDKMSVSLITSALREAVLMNKINFKYIDRILREWKRKGIRSVEEAEKEARLFRMNQPKKEYKVEKRDTSVYFNWLEGDIE